jgi:carbon storage regulator
MLVLRRKVGESIIINHNVRVTVHQVIGNTIRLAIDAPKDVSVNREELELRIAAEGKDEE